ncbi:hypothetical protein SAMN02745177_00299 [Desulforamulus hydrothermalis Lam5 = DSM 18033]|nr:hypothetical protein SAMN02745177_00299 [Desulforamulus hydrothermalis Lam5 = DSM 18033]
MIPCRQLVEAPVTVLDERKEPLGGARIMWAPAGPVQKGAFEAIPRAGANHSAVGSRSDNKIFLS